jgi:hypothetical protein
MNKTITLTTPQGDITVVERKLTYRKVRYGSGPQSYWNARNNREYDKLPRIYVSTESQEAETVADDMNNRTRRPHVIWRGAVKRMFADAGVEKYIVGLRWDQHAGCSMCPCSPGFVVQRTEDAPFQRYDIYVTLRNTACVDESKPGRLEDRRILV